MKYIPLSRIQVIDGLRQFFAGSNIPFLETVAMLILIHQLKGTVAEKTLLAVFIKSGLLLGIPFTLLVANKRFKIGNLLSSIYFLGGVGALGLMLLPYPYMLMMTSGCIGLAVHGTHPIQSEIYNLFHKEERGMKSSFTIFMTALSSVIMSLLLNLFFNAF